MMNRLLVALYKLDTARRSGRLPHDVPTRVRVWIDPRLRASVDPIDCERAFDGTTDWATLAACRMVLPVAGDLREASDCHLILCDDAERVSELTGDAIAGGSVVFDSSLPPHGSLDYSLCLEAAHHDHELCGYNGWLADGRVQFSRYILWHLSAAQCKAHFPQYVIPELEQLARSTGRPVDALDIGCGMLSRLRWGQVRGLLRTTGVDPLLNIYRAILARHGLLALPHITPATRLPMLAEDLSSDMIAGRFGLVYTSNALDHTQNPERVVALMGAALRPEGLGIIQGAVNEGTRENWSELHQFDFRVESDRLICAARDGSERALVGPDHPLRIEKVHSLTDEHMCFVVRRQRASP